MGHGTILVGTGSFNQEAWHDQVMPELLNDDAIHVYQIRMSEELRMMDLAHLNDPVLKRLLDMGCFDWKSPNSVLGPGNGIAYSAVVASRLLPRLLEVEDKVRHLAVQPLFSD